MLGAETFAQGRSALLELFLGGGEAAAQKSDCTQTDRHEGAAGKTDEGGFARSDQVPGAPKKLI